MEGTYEKTLKTIFVVIITILMLLVMITNVSDETAEGTGIVENSETKEFYLKDETKTIKLNSTSYLSYENKPVGENIVWTSADEDIATVDKSGLVTGKAIGKTTITAKIGEQEDTCEVIVEYSRVTISSNESKHATSINLVLKEHPIETLKVKVEDGKYKEVANAEITWKSGDAKVATVDANGKVTAVGVGTATITVEAAGVSDTCEVNVVAAPEFTDFSKAKYELLYDYSADLKISEITPEDEGYYYYMITDTNEKPALEIHKGGSVNATESDLKSLRINTEENYVFATGLDEYVELNQELYLWVIQQVNLDKSYYNGENRVYYSTKFVVEGQKLTRPELPQLNLILKGFSIAGNWNNESAEQDSSTWITFRFPTAIENLV